MEQGSFLGCSGRGTHVRAEGLQHVQKAIAAVMTHTEVEGLGRKVRIKIQRCERQRRYCAPLGQRHVMHCTWWQLLRFGPGTGCHGCSIPCETFPMSLFGNITGVKGLVRRSGLKSSGVSSSSRDIVHPWNCSILYTAPAGTCAAHWPEHRSLGLQHPWSQFCLPPDCHEESKLTAL